MSNLKAATNPTVVSPDDMLAFADALTDVVNMVRGRLRRASESYSPEEEALIRQQMNQVSNAASSLRREALVLSLKNVQSAIASLEKVTNDVREFLETLDQIRQGIAVTGQLVLVVGAIASGQAAAIIPAVTALEGML